MNCYSYAGTARGKTDPDDVFVTTVSGESCDLDHCMTTHEHLVIMWSGDEYSRNHTWISADKEFTISLEDAR